MAGVADLVLIVLAPGLGDSIQLLKAGLMEIGDVFVVNKADRPDAARLHGELLAMLQASRDDETGTTARLIACGRIDRRPGAVAVAAPRDAHRPANVPRERRTGPGCRRRWWTTWRRCGATHRAAAGRPSACESIEQEVRDAVVEEASRRLRATLRDRQAPGDRIAAGVLVGPDSRSGGAAADLLAATATAGRGA